MQSGFVWLRDTDQTRFGVGARTPTTGVSCSEFEYTVRYMKHAIYNQVDVANPLSIKGLISEMLGLEKLEKEVDREFEKKLRELPFKVAAKKILGSSNDINEPDWFICVCGRLLLIETKAPVSVSKITGRPRKQKKEREGQRIRAKWWQRAGARYIVCSNADDMISAVREIYDHQMSLLERRDDNIY